LSHRITAPTNQAPSPTERDPGEVIVVGGSAAGLYTALNVARGGKRVRVLESKPSLQPASRTLIVTNHFRKQLGSFADECIVNEIRRFELFTDGRSAQVVLANPDLIIERTRLISLLAREAEHAGAKISFDTRFLSMSSRGRSLRVEADCAGRKQELYTENLVGADGAASRVARAAGWAPLDTVPLVQAIVPWPKDCPPDTTRVWFVPDDTPYFYWLIPESPQRGALGVIGENGLDTARSLSRFLEKKQIQPLEWQGARVPLYRGWVPVRRPIGHGQVYLVGDAAAQVKVSTVGGVITGFRGALGVAESILGKRLTTELLGLRRELETHRLLRRTMHYFQQKEYSRLVDLLNVATRATLKEMTRNESTRLLWNVLRRQPQLVLLGLRGLLLGKPHRPPASE
jgi:digeranylgeranylglycerophospholipid reductase